jgi:hypothetical protein
MKRAFNLLGMIALFFLVSAPVFSQEDRILLKSDELGKHKRALVVFPHKNHEDLIDCRRCHHEYDDFQVNTGGEGGKCSECHSTKNNSNQIPLMKAFHLQCKGCHKKMNTGQDLKLPVMCGQCHIKTVIPATDFK